MPRPSQAELDAIRQKHPELFDENGAARLGAPPSSAPRLAPAAPAPTRRPAQTATRATDKSFSETMAGETEDERLRRAFLLEVEREARAGGAPLAPEAMREEAARRATEKAAEVAPPLSMGQFTPVAYTAPAPAPGPPLARPQEVTVTKPPTMGEAMAPQTRVGEVTASRIEREETAGLFDDAAFTKSVAGLAEDKKREQLDAYEAYKAAFKAIREKNPKETGVTNEDIRRDLDRQIAALGSGDIRTVADDPANRMGYTGDPLARALQRQVTTGTTPILEPGQMAFVQTLDRLQRDRRKAEGATAAETRLRTKGVEIMRTEKRATGERGPGGRPIMEDVKVGTGQFRPASEAEIAEAKKNVSAFEEKADALPFYLTPDRDKVLSNIEGSATGGTIFEKKYPTGATVESPVSWFVRAAMTVPNALVGAVSDVYTPDVITERERAARPALYRDASSAVYNVSASRGLMGEIGDLYEYAPETWTMPGTGRPLKEYTTLAKTAGFAGDLIGFDLGLIAGAVTGTRTAVAAGRAARAAGFVAPGREALKGGLKGASAEFLSTIGLKSLANKVPVGDVRLQFGSSVGDSYRGADVYLRSLDEQAAAARSAGTPPSPNFAHLVALDAVEQRAPYSKFIDDAYRAGPDIANDIRAGKYFDKAPEFAEFRRVADAADEVMNPLAGDPTRLSRAAQTLKPYLGAAVRSVPEVYNSMSARLFNSVNAGRITLPELFTDIRALPEPVREKFMKAVVDTAAAEKGFTTIDRATKGIDPGRFTVRLTPSTFVTEDAADKVLAKVKETPEYKLVSDITKRPLGADGKYDVGDLKMRLYDIITRENATGTLSQEAAREMRGSTATTGPLTGLADSTITPEHLRQLMFSVTDSVASQMRVGFKPPALAAQTTRAVPRRGEVPVPSTRVDVGENVGFINSAMKRAWDWTLDAFREPSSLANVLSPDQLRIIEDGKRAIGAIPQRLKSALADAEGANNTEKLINMALRAVPGEEAGVGLNIEFWNDVARSAIFGKTDRSLWSWAKGDFTYTDPFALLTEAGRKQLYELSAQYSAKVAKPPATTADVATMFPAYVQEVRALINPETMKGSFIDAGGKVFDLSAKPEEVLLATWARKEAAAIHDVTTARVLDFEPDTVDFINAVFRDALRGVKDADGQSLAGRPLGILVAEAARPGGKVITTTDEMLGLDAIKDWMAAVDTALQAPGKGEELLRMFGGGILGDVVPTAAVIQNRFVDFPVEAMAADMKRLMSGEATLGEVGSPLGTLFGKAMQEELGSTGKYAELLSELGQLAERAAKGDGKAVALRRFMSQTVAAANSFFYNSVLYFNPRYHGINFVTAPAIGYSTTGRVPMGSAATPLADLMQQALNGRLSAPARNIVVARDPSGVPYTFGQVYDAATRGGAFKSQAQANLDPRFLADARELGIGTGLLGKGSVSAAEKAARQLVSLPSGLANLSDNVWRMQYTVDALQQGKTLDEALAVGRKSLYDYGAATEFERQYIAKNILFYNFFRNSVLQTWQMLLTQPSRFVRMARATQDITRLNVGEDKWEDMRFYTPYDAGISRIVTQFAPQANKEGRITLLPQMPYYDAVYLLSGLMTMPLDLVRGVPDPRTGERTPGSSYVFGKLSPSAQMLIGSVVGMEYAYDIKLKKDVAAPQHVAIADSTGMLPAMTALFNMKARPEEPGEAGYNGMVYTMAPEDFARYREWLKNARLVGVQRPFEDFSKMAASWEWFGPGGVATGFTEQSTVTGLEAAGVTTQTGAGLPVEAETRAAETRAALVKEATKQQELSAGDRRPKEKAR
jgi:hypothetical protein